MTAHAEGPGVARSAAERLSLPVASIAIAVALVGIAYRPGLLTPVASVLALAAGGMSGSRPAFARAGVAIVALAWFAGMTLAAATGRALF